MRALLPLGGAALVLAGVSSAGSASAAYSVLLQPGGKIVVAGWGQRGSQDTVGLARYTPAGALDKSYGLQRRVATSSAGARGPTRPRCRRTARL